MSSRPRATNDLDDVLASLEHDGLLRNAGNGHQTTRRWQGAMMRAALGLVQRGEDGDDLRVPVAIAMFELYGDQLGDIELARRIEAMATIEAGSLSGVSTG